MSPVSTALAAGVATIGAQPTTTVICPANTCVTLPVTIAGNVAPQLLGYSVTFQLSPELALCSGTASVVEGNFLSAGSSTLYQVVNNLDGTYTVDDVVAGGCGAVGASGTLFTIGVKSAVAGGTGTVTVTTVKMRDCQNQVLGVVAGPPATVPIDNQAPVVTVTSPNGGETWLSGSTHAITWTATDNVGVANVDLAYSTNGGATYPNVIASGAPNTGTYTWTVPGVTTAQARVRVTAHDTGCSSGSDASDANFAIGGLQIVASAGANGTIAPSGAVAVANGGSQTFTIAASACNHIADVVVDGASVGAVGSYTFTNVTANHTIVASFAGDTYAIAAFSGPGGTIAPVGGTTAPGVAEEFNGVALPAGWSSFIWPAGSGPGTSTVSGGVLTVNGTRVNPEPYTGGSARSLEFVATFATEPFQSAGLGSGSQTQPGEVFGLTPYAVFSTGATGTAVYTRVYDGGASSVDFQVPGALIGTPHRYRVAWNPGGVDFYVDGTLVHTELMTFAGSMRPAFSDIDANATALTVDWVRDGPFPVACGASQAFTIVAAGGYHIADVVVDGASRGPVAAYTFSNVQGNHTLAASFAAGVATIGAQSTTTVICPANTCVTLPVTIAGNVAPQLLGYSVTFQLSPELALCSGTASAVEGNFLSAGSSTLYQVVNNLDGTYTVDDVVAGGCGAVGASGTLFTIGVKSAVAGGTGTVTVTTVKMRDCQNQVLGVVAGPPATVPIDNQAPVVTVTSPNGGETWPSGSTHAITWTATDNVGVANVDIAYSTNGGATYPNVIASGVPNTGTYTWTVPGVTTTQARVRVTAHDTGCSSGSDASNASFAIGGLQIVASAGANGSITPSGTVAVAYGGSQGFTIAPAACYSVATLTVDGSAVTPATSYTFTNVTADHTIAVTFALNSYTIVASAGANGTISPSGNVAVNCGGSKVFTMTPSAGYHVASVLVDGASVGTPTSYTFTNVRAGHTIAASFAANTIVLPSLSICDAWTLEGNSGTRVLCFTVALSSASSQTVTVRYATKDGAATAANHDYQPASATLSFPPGVLSRTIGITVYGDTKVEPNEMFQVVLSNPTNGTISRGTGVGTIVNDDGLAKPLLCINDVRMNEGKSGTTRFVFTVTLSGSASVPVTVRYATADITAKVSDGDYVAQSGTLNIPARQLSGTIAVLVKGDTKVESDKTFALVLGNPTNATIHDGQGIGTIVNDDGTLAAAAVSLPTRPDIDSLASGPAIAEGGSMAETLASLALAIGPNPMRDRMSVTFSLPTEATVHMAVLDLQGRKIGTLADGWFAAGSHTLSLSSGSARLDFPAGVYFVRLTTPDRSLVQRFVRVR